MSEEKSKSIEDRLISALNKAPNVELIKRAIFTLVFLNRKYLHEPYNSHRMRRIVLLFGEDEEYKIKIASLLTELYKEDGLIKENKMIIANREDVVGIFRNQSEEKISKLMEESINGTLFIKDLIQLFSGPSDLFGAGALHALKDSLINNKDSHFVFLSINNNDNSEEEKSIMEMFKTVGDFFINFN